MKRTSGVLGVPAIAILIVIGGAFANFGASNEPIVAKVDRPEKEGVSRSLSVHGAANDSCVSSNHFHLPARRTGIC